MRGLDIYEDTNCNEIDAKIVASCQDLVIKIAKSYKKKLPSHIELADLIQSGYVGLIEASKTFKPGHGACFETYASSRIKGSIIDELRKNSWGTRDGLKIMRNIAAAINHLEQHLCRQPTAEEVAMHLNVSTEEYADMCYRVNVCQVASMDETLNFTAVDETMPSPDQVVESDNFNNKIKSELKNLDERDQLLLSLYYNDDLTFKEIAQIMDLTEARICQLHANAISRIRLKIES